MGLTMEGPKNDLTDEDIPTPAEMRVLIEDEKRFCREALEVRLKEYEAIIVAYEKGEVDFEGFCDLRSKHNDKWGEPVICAENQEGSPPGLSHEKTSGSGPSITGRARDRGPRSR